MRRYTNQDDCARQGILRTVPRNCLVEDPAEELGQIDRKTIGICHSLLGFDSLLCDEKRLADFLGGADKGVELALLDWALALLCVGISNTVTVLVNDVSEAFL